MENKDMLKAYEEIGTVEDCRTAMLFNEIGIANIMEPVEYINLPKENDNVCLLFYNDGKFVASFPAIFKHGKFNYQDAKEKFEVPKFDMLYWTSLDFFERGV